MSIMEREDLAHFTMGGPTGYRIKITGRPKPSDYLGEQYGDLEVYVMIESDLDDQQGEWMPLDDALDLYNEVEFL